MATINPDPLRRVGRALDGALWLVALLVGAYSLANVHSVAIGHHTDDPQAWLLAPIVDLALFAGITADSVLARHGLHPTRWGTGLRWFCGLATWTLNVWDAAASLDAGAIVAHSVPPVVLILLAEAAPRYRHQFATLTTTPPADLPAPAPTPATEAASPPPASTPTTDPTSPTKGVPAPRTGTSPRRRTGTPCRRRARLRPRPRPSVAHSARTAPPAHHRRPDRPDARAHRCLTRPTLPGARRPSRQSHPPRPGPPRKEAGPS